MGKCVEPLVPVTSVGGETCKYRVSPAEDVQAARSKGVLAGAVCRATVFASKNDMGDGLMTLNQGHRFVFRELLYPGNQQIEVVDKWIYAWRNGQLVAEIHAKTAEEWLICQDPDPSAELDARTLAPAPIAALELPGVSSAEPETFEFFLSPIRLGARSLEMLGGEANKESTLLIRQEVALPTELVVIADPWRWASELNSQYYLPKLTSWKRWVQDKKRQSKLFVASVLKGWIDGGDPGSVEGKLADGQPDEFLNKYKEDEQAKRLEAEEACALLVHKLDSIECWAIEMSAIDHGEHDLSWCFQAWCSSLQQILETEPGRTFAHKLVSDTERVPARYLFGETSPGNLIDFAKFRYAWLAADGIFCELLPAVARKLTNNAKAVEQVLETTLEKLKLKQLTKKHRRIYAAFAADPKQADKLLSTAPAKPRGKMMRTWRALQKEMSEAEGPPTTARKVGKSIDKLHGDYRHVMGGLRYSLGAILEVANFVFALSEYRSAKPDKKNLWSVVGSSGDLAAFMAGTVETLMKEGLGRRAVGALAGSAAFIAGACEMVDHEGKAIGAVADGDYNQAVGHGIAMGGAAMTAIGGGMIVVEMVSGGALFGGPIGAIVGAIGAVLIVGGTVLAAWLKDNAYQQFAMNCFLGEDANADTRYYSWAPAGLPAGPQTEVKCLLTLLCAYRVTFAKYLDNAYITIKPGYLPDNARFDVAVDNQWHAAGELRSLIQVDLRSDQIFHAGGIKPAMGGGIERDADGRVTSIRVICDHDLDKLMGSYISFRTGVRLDINGDGKLWSPRHRDWTRTTLVPASLFGNDTKDVSSLEEDNLKPANDFKW